MYIKGRPYHFQYLDLYTHLTAVDPIFTFQLDKEDVAGDRQRLMRLIFVGISMDLRSQLQATSEAPTRTVEVWGGRCTKTVVVHRVVRIFGVKIVMVATAKFGKHLYSIKACMILFANLLQVMISF